MNNIEFENTFDAGLLDDEYMNFIMENVDTSEWIITNADKLLEASEALYLFNEFRRSIVTE